MISAERLAVIDNIKERVSRGAFNEKVEINDPTLSEEQVREELYKIVKQREGIPYGVRNFLARRFADVMAVKINKKSSIIGSDNISDVKGPAIVTSNHFAPFENTLIRLMTSRHGKGNLWAVSQDTNFVMPGWKGFLLRYTDLIPITHDKGFMCSFFEQMLGEALNSGHFVLVYPEQEMWFNYRKPRPPKRGAYHYAAKFGVPVVSCFTQIDDAPGTGPDGVGNTSWTLHILKPIFPDPGKTLKENSLEMMEKDYAQKKEAYEKAYGKPLDYAFEPWDVAGYEAGMAE